MSESEPESEQLRRERLRTGTEAPAAKLVAEPLLKKCAMPSSWAPAFWSCSAAASFMPRCWPERKNGLWQVAIVWGVAVMLAIYAVGAISGAHINPSITLAFAARGKFPWRLVVPYIVSQTVGAFAAAAILFALFGPLLAAKEQEKHVVRGSPGSEVTAMCYGEYFPNPGLLVGSSEPYSEQAQIRINALVSEPMACLAEVVGTLLLALVVFAVTDDRNHAAPAGQMAPMFIGLTIAARNLGDRAADAGLLQPGARFWSPAVRFLCRLGPYRPAGPARDGFPDGLYYFTHRGSAGRSALCTTLSCDLQFQNQSKTRFDTMTEIRRLNWLACSLILGIASLGLLLATGAKAADEPLLDPGQPYQAQRSNPVTYDVDFSVVVTAPAKTKVLKVWLPLPQTDPGQEVTEEGLSTFPTTVEGTITQEPVNKNKFAYFEFAAPQGAQIIRHKFKIKVWELHWNIDPDKIVAVDNWPATFDRYRRGETQSVVVDERFEKLVKQIVPKPSNPLRDMASVIAWVGKNIQYDHNDASLQARLGASARRAPRALQRLPWVLRRHGPRDGLPDARHLRHQRVPEKFAVALQARSLSAAVWLG